MRDSVGLETRLAQLRDAYPNSDPQIVGEVARAILASLYGELTPDEAAFLSEVEGIARKLARARSEISALRVSDISASHLPEAHDELGAIVAHTAAATDAILDCCEQLDAAAPNLSGMGAQMMQDITGRIYEACTFQDITGQRIGKIAATLKLIEAKVDHIAISFSRNRAQSALPGRAEPRPVPVTLESGPQLPALAMDQQDIDALLASFD